MMTQRFRFIAVVLGLVLAAAGATVATAQRNTRLSDPQVLTLLERSVRNAQRLHQLIERGPGRGVGRGQGAVHTTQIEVDIHQLVTELMDTTVHLRDHQTRRQVVDNDVDEVLIRGARIDEYMRRNQLGVAIRNSWTTVRRDLDELARAFNLDWNWTSPRLTPRPGPAYYSRLSGTYQLDRARSDNAQRLATQAARGLPLAQRQRVEQELLSRLSPPEFISLDRNGRTVSIASSGGPRATFDIDGLERTEPNDLGGISTVRAAFYGDELMVTTTGNRGRDFTVTFEPLDLGNTLRVTRSLDVQGLATRVQANSIYRRTEELPRWNVYTVPTRSSLIVPDGTVLIGRLNTSLGNRTSRQGDRFSLTVSGPQPYQGAVIDGIVTRVGNPNRPDRNELIFDFERIRLRDGRTAEFQGVLDRVRTPDGNIVQIDTAGVVRSGSRTRDTVEGGAIGAAFGAIIGAIAGGGKGAAIGAAIGAGAGAGTVYVVGRDLSLPAGTEVFVIAESYPDR